MFKEIDPRQDFVALEHEIIKFWNEHKIQDKYLVKNQHAEKRWSFLDGPITANNPMGVHHAWGRTLKDLWQRFYTMKGYAQRYQNGFDCQGLWVEVEVEKELGFKTKKDIETYGVDKFVEKCKERVMKYSGIQAEQSKRLAEWMDWDHSYYTMSEENNYTIWHFLKVCFENGWIYKGTDSVPWCPRCGTAISQHEILTEEYKEITHDSVFFKLPIKEKATILEKTKNNNLSFLVWTTTPWTIPANVAVAVDPEKEYGIYSDGETNLIVLQSRAPKVLPNEFKFQQPILGKDLLDIEYEMPFDEFEGLNEIIGNYKRKTVASDDMILPVSEDEGTGMVHIAPGAGAEDFRLGKKYQLPVVKVINEDASYMNHMGEFAGKNAKKNPELIFDFIKNKDNGKFLFKIQAYKHRYPTCWRCKEELVWRNVNEWYISMDQPSRKATADKSSQLNFREKMIGVAKKINWIPSWGKDRELDWLNNMHDWLISKKRYWGLALPIWECECGHFEVIGSKDELKEKATSGFDKFEGHTPHKPFIDEVKIKCDKCGKEMKRIPDVGNPWLDAGIVPFSTLIDPATKKVSYLTDKKYWSKWFPADFITECFPGQFKNWFYALIAMSTALENDMPYKTLLGHGLVKDEHGQEMHKSKGNAIWFEDAAEKMGVDLMRWIYVRQNPVQNLNFGYNPAKEVLRTFVLTLWNTYSFFVTYANADKWDVEVSKKISIDKRPILDQWILVRLNELISSVEENLSKYNSYLSASEIEKFVNDLSTWYLRLTRKRRDEAFYQTMHEVLTNLCIVLAPFMPHIAEAIFQNLRTKSDPISIHLSVWPQTIEKNETILQKMQNIRNIIELAHAARREAQIKVRQPLQELIVTKSEKVEDELVDIIKQELNIKEIKFTDVVPSDKKYITKEGYYLQVSLNTEISESLKEEGMLREIVRQIQFARKRSGYKALDKISLHWFSDNTDVKNIFDKFKQQIIDSTLCKDITNDKVSDAKFSKDVKIDQADLFLAIV